MCLLRLTSPEDEGKDEVPALVHCCRAAPPAPAYLSVQRGGLHSGRSPQKVTLLLWVSVSFWYHRDLFPRTVSSGNARALSSLTPPRTRWPLRAYLRNTRVDGAGSLALLPRGFPESAVRSAKLRVGVGSQKYP